MFGAAFGTVAPIATAAALGTKPIKAFVVLLAASPLVAVVSGWIAYHSREWWIGEDGYFWSYAGMAVGQAGLTYASVLVLRVSGYRLMQHEPNS